MHILHTKADLVLPGSLSPYLAYLPPTLASSLSLSLSLFPPPLSFLLFSLHELVLCPSPPLLPFPHGYSPSLNPWGKRTCPPESSFPLNPPLIYLICPELAHFTGRLPDKVLPSREGMLYLFFIQKAGEWTDVLSGDLCAVCVATDHTRPSHRPSLFSATLQNLSLQKVAHLLYKESLFSLLSLKQIYMCFNMHTRLS